jgi:hypothetical protein
MRVRIFTPALIGGENAPCAWETGKLGMEKDAREKAARSRMSQLP